MLTTRQQLGIDGEAIAERWLEARGWTVLARRFRSGHRDIDLVIARPCDEGRMVAFVEVKTRTTENFGGPLAAVHWRKQRELARAAREWLRSSDQFASALRFDVVGVTLGKGSPEIVHIENAFQLR
jgi:putative endonuclease